MDSVKTFLSQIWSLLSTSTEMQLTLSIFSLAIIFSNISRALITKQYAPIKAAFNQEIANQFKISTAQPLKLTSSLYRLAATNWGVQSNYRSFRMILQLNNSSNLLQKMIDYVFYSEPNAVIQLKVQPQTKNIYGALIKQNEVTQCKKSFEKDLCWFQPAKVQTVGFQTYENYSNFASMLSIDNIDFIIFANDEFTVKCSLQFVPQVLKSLLCVAQQINEISLNESEQKQMDKNVHIAQKQLAVIKSQKESQMAEENVSKKIAYLQEQLRSKTLKESERSQIQSKLDQIEKKEKAKQIKSMQKAMGMAQQGGKRGQMVMK